MMDAARALELDHVRFVSADYHGIDRGKTVPIAAAEKFFQNGLTYALLGFGLVPRCQPPFVPEVDEAGYPDCLLQPDIESLRWVPWADENGEKVGQVECDGLYKPPSSLPFPYCPRAVARRQIEELGSFGYRIYFAPENEFFLASKENLSKPFFDGDDWGANILADGLKSYIFDVIRKAKAARIQVEAWHIEYNPGQVEITLEPEMGLQAADNWLVFRQGVKETALLHGLTATFMSKPFMIDETGSGSHFNHSIWTHGGENAFWNPEAEDNLSEFARHWVAGLLAHAPAMTALCNPTVNCYRRLHIHFTPHLVNWGIDNRTTLVRVKNHSQDSTFAEGRLPSSAANPYIVIAAYIAAGMDGVKRKLPLPEKADRKATKLPVSLPEAIKALTSDKILIEAMGKKFMELFFKIKEIELRSLGATADVNDESVFAREREIYMKLI